MPVTAILLLAGYEKKLSPLSDSMHQSLLSIGSTTLLERMLENLSEQGVEKAVLVIGHYGNKVIDLIGTSHAGVDIEYVWNHDYMKTNVMYSLWLAKKFVEGPFLIVDGDIFWEAEALLSVLHQPLRSFVIVDSTAPLKNGCVKVIIRDSQVRAIGKQAQADGDEVVAPAVGISYISADMAPALFDLIDKLVSLGQKQLVYEDALNALLNEFPVQAVDISGITWAEMDNLESLEAIYQHTGEPGELEAFARSFGASMAMSIEPKNIVFDQRTKLLCFNCGRYGKKLTCPPHIPDIDYQKILLSYSKAMLVSVRMTVSQERDFATIREMSTNAVHKILLLLEKVAFKQNAYYVTSFIGGSCKLCSGECGDYCRNPQDSRIPMEAVGIDVVKTAELAGIHLRFPAEDSISRVGLLLIS